MAGLGCEVIVVHLETQEVNDASGDLVDIVATDIADWYNYGHYDYFWQAKRDVTTEHEMSYSQDDWHVYRDTDNYGTLWAIVSDNEYGNVHNWTDTLGHIQAMIDLGLA